MTAIVKIKGGPGSGHHGHAGRPGVGVGGSVAGTGSLAGASIQQRPDGSMTLVLGSGRRVHVHDNKAVVNGRLVDVSHLIEKKPTVPFDEENALRFKTTTDVEEYGDEEWQHWAASLHPGAEEAYQWYANGFQYSAYNDMLRHPEQFPDLANDRSLQEQIQLMKSAALPLRNDIIAYRTFGGKTSERIAAMKEGETFADKAFVSTSLIDNWYGEKHTTVIRVPKGTKAAYLGGFSDMESLSEMSDDENELLLMPGLTFRVVGDQGGFRVLEVVNE